MKISKSQYKQIKIDMKSRTGFDFRMVYVAHQRMVMITRYNKSIAVVQKEFLTQSLFSNISHYCILDGENWVRDQFKGLLKL